MRRTIPTLALLSLICPCLSAQQSSIEGIAIDAISHQPMAGVHIMLHSMATDARASDDSVTYGAISQQNGHFSITGLKPDLYILEAERNGYVQVPANPQSGLDNATVALKSGEQLTNLKVQMTPQAVISGHVLDEYGDPFEGATVEALQDVPGTAEPRLAMMRERSDDRGQFRLTGPPGTFYLRAAPPFGGLGLPSDFPHTAYAATYYPASPDKDQATPIEVATGRDLAGIEIQLARKPSLTISVQVTGVPESSEVPTIVVSTFSDRYKLFRVMGEFQTDYDGKLTLSGLSPGRYRLLATLQSKDKYLQSMIAELQIAGPNDTSLSLALVHGESLSGTVEIQGKPAKIAPDEKLTIRLEHDSELRAFEGVQTEGTEVGGDGAFRFDQVFPEKFRVRVVPLPENAFVKSVKLDDAEMTDGVLDLSRGVSGSAIQVTLSRNGASLQGKVLDRDGEPPIPLAFVVLASTAEEIDRESIKPVAAGEGFTFRGLHPGKYRVIAVDPRQFRDAAEGIRALFPTAPEIEIHEGDRISRDVTISAPEKPDAQR